MHTTFFRLAFFLLAMTSVSAQEIRPSAGLNNNWYVYNDSDTVFVFVHGILSDSRDAWYYSGDAKNPPNYWPELINSITFDHPSIFLGGFYTEALSGDYTIRDAAEELFSYLSISKAPASTPVLAKKNIIFIAHSLGGIAVRHMLTKRGDAFSKKNVGLFLVASPSLGAKDADRLGFALDLVNNEMGKELKWKNSNLVELDKDFRNLVDQDRNRTIVGTETIENHFYTKLLFFFNRKVVVDEESGGRYFGAPIRIGGSDHSSIAKPKNDSEQIHFVLRQFYEKKFLPLVLRNRKSELIPPEDLEPTVLCKNSHECKNIVGGTSEISGAATHKTNASLSPFSDFFSEIELNDVNTGDPTLNGSLACQINGMKYYDHEATRVEISCDENYGLIWWDDNKKRFRNHKVPICMTREATVISRIRCKA